MAKQCLAKTAQRKSYGINEKRQRIGVAAVFRNGSSAKQMAWRMKAHRVWRRRKSPERNSGNRASQRLMARRRGL